MSLNDGASCGEKKRAQIGERKCKNGQPLLGAFCFFSDDCSKLDGGRVCGHGVGLVGSKVILLDGSHK